MDEESRTSNLKLNPDQYDRAAGHDALCFMAGPQGAYFGAGVIHAYLAADRKAPVVVAGISAGSLTSAAMYQAYSELNAVDGNAEEKVREAARWKWFRRYLDALTNDPLSAIWDALPNPVEFYDDTTPVEDPSCPEDLKRDETEARDHYHRLIRLGNWLGSLPVSVADVADAAVRYVRAKEGYAHPKVQWILLLFRLLLISVKVAVHIALDPRIAFWRATYNTSAKTSQQFLKPTPLFGWLWPISLLWLTPLIVTVYRLSTGSYEDLLLILVLLFCPLAFAKWILSRFVSPLLLKPLGIEQGLLHKYHMKRWLQKLFGETHIQSPQPCGGPFHLLVVAATLSRIKYPERESKGSSKSAQLWARSGLLRDALTSTLAVPTIFAPEKLTAQQDIEKWLANAKALDNGELVLIDGAVIRSNPLPALFNWLGRHYEREPETVKKLFHTPDQPGASLRVVYSVPITGLTREQEIKRETLDIVENAFISLSLQRRRDTEMESKQTDFISTLEAETRRVNPNGAPTKKPIFPIFPMPISPERELTFKNSLDPTRVEGLEQIAQGCRRTLESVYRNSLKQSQTRCAVLLRELAGRRAGSITYDVPGLPEVCRHCPGVLNKRDVESSKLDKSVASFGLPTTASSPNGLPNPELSKTFPALIGRKPRVALIANGGVFRGSFHVGVAAALRVAGIKPDLVVGASVGTIIGAAVSVMSRHRHDTRAFEYACKLAKVFLECDKEVALTQSLKRVCKQLGIRARDIHVSPRLLRKKIREGSREDSSYAITGAPPVLIDAISDLFLIPRKTTQAIAALFVSGKITQATKLFFTAVQRETLRRLAIEKRIMGADLLEDTARQLLFPVGSKENRLSDQPFLNPGEKKDRHPVAFFATSTLLSRRSTILLGRDFPVEIPAPAQFDFLEACLASSAFPVVFAPRASSALFPGQGRTDALLCDGGIFDNLPFFPAIEVLAAVQASHAGGSTPAECYKYLEDRQKAPVLMIAAGLDGGPEPSPTLPKDLLGIRKLAGSLNAHVKINSFERVSQSVHEQINSYWHAYAGREEEIDTEFANSIVPAAVLKILPADADHLNGTFAFCRSVGLKDSKMQTSIAHGCFQTLDGFASAVGAPETPPVLSAALEACSEKGRLLAIEYRKKNENVGSDQCWFFRKNHQEFRCPFTHSQEAKVAKIHSTCKDDRVHVKRASQMREVPRREDTVTTTTAEHPKDTQEQLTTGR